MGVSTWELVAVWLRLCDDSERDADPVVVWLREGRESEPECDCVRELDLVKNGEGDADSERAVRDAEGCGETLLGGRDPVAEEEADIELLPDCVFDVDGVDVLSGAAAPTSSGGYATSPGTPTLEYVNSALLSTGGKLVTVPGAEVYNCNSMNTFGPRSCVLTM